MNTDSLNPVAEYHCLYHYTIPKGLILKRKIARFLKNRERTE